MSEELELSILLIELDALLDTRLAILAKNDDKVLESILLNGYHTRLQDKFKDIDNNKFKLDYKDRSKDILKDCIVTPMSEFIKDFSTNTLKLLISTPFHYKPKILLNIYPYKLSEEDIVILIESLISITNGLADIEVIDMSYEDITPKYVKSNLSIMILYDYSSWLEIHSTNKNFEKTTCPEVTLIGPRLYFKDNIEASELDPFNSMEILISPLIGLQLFPIEYFSSVLRLDIYKTP